MALRIGRKWLAFGMGVAFGLALLLGWAWHDGGTRDLVPMSAPAMLPGDRQ